MFIISLTYKVDIENGERYIPEHHSFLQKYYEPGMFIASGRKEPRTGGIVICNAASRNRLNSSLQKILFIFIR